MKALLAWFKGLWARIGPKPDPLQVYLERRLEELLEPKHWTRVIEGMGAVSPTAMYAIGADGLTLTRLGSGSVCLQACGVDFWWSPNMRTRSPVYLVITGAPLVDSRHMPPELTDRFCAAVAASWLHCGVPVRTPQTPAEWIAHAEAERARLGCDR